uniref:Uncharacterized protein n=1 Tax=Calcidiscus leptoporus TaxID=127549 RepID=A0A7S0J9B5_9EUKA|mmetsp:Transcript_46103/g.107465  ORF Transcript_46103/g.107465 Transcript_46103/m.107465 type:complete len:119 (+) Transcript_46103:47-403(+)
MKLTAEQYSACWKERIAKEEAAQETAVAGSIKQRGHRPPTAQSDKQVDDDTRSVCSHASRVSETSSYHSDISSRVSSSSSSARKIEMLQKQLQEETDRRLKLEHELRKGGGKTLKITS